MGPLWRRRNLWILAAVALAVVVAGTLVVFGVTRQAEDSRPDTLASPPGSSSTSASTVSPDATPSTQSTPSTAPQDSGAAAALNGCRTKVQAGDDVMAAAEVGMGHWSEHIQAQTDANAGKITVEEMEEIFSRTMEAGDEDEQRYTEAVKTHDGQDGSCQAVADASAEVTAQLVRCAERGRAHQPVLDAAADGMADWTKHLGEMRRSMKGKIHNPQKTWLRTWRAAPPHINAYEKAAKQFSAPDC